MCHLPARGGMTWNTKLSSREQNWSKSDKSNILSSTILTSSSPSCQPGLQLKCLCSTEPSAAIPLLWDGPHQMPWNGSCFGPGDPCWNEASLVARLLFQPLLHSASYILITPTYSHWVSIWKGQFFLLEAWEGQVCISQSSSYQKVTETRCYILSYTRLLFLHLFVRAFHTHLPDLFPFWRLNVFEWVNPGKHFKHLPCFWLNAEQCYGWAVAR